MVDSKVLISISIFILTFYLFVGFASVNLDKNIDVKTDLQESINAIPTNSSDIESGIWQTYKGTSSGISTIWAIMTFKIFGLPSMIGLIVNTLLIGIFSLIVILEIIKLVRGV